MSETRLVVPPQDAEPWPTLGFEVADFIEANLVHGPGDLLGEPVELTDEIRRILLRCYEVFPRDHPLAGRRRIKRAGLSRRKGWAKTELAAFLAIVEMDPEGPVRCDGWRKEGGEWIPVGRPVRDPYIPMVATTEEQTEDLAYGAVKAILERCDLGNDYEPGVERTIHRREPGVIQPLASAPRARDGARTTFQHFDETHLFVEERLKRAHRTMLRNVPKRKAADAWSLETTTMYAPGEDSVAEATHRYAEALERGNVADPQLLFDHRQASEKHDISTDKGLRAALREASGDAWSFTDVEAVVGQFRDPTSDENENRRFWLNQRRKRRKQWVALQVWDSRRTKRLVVPQTRAVISFDGSYNRDSTALMGATVEAAPQIFTVKVWERPINDPSYRTPRGAVLERIRATFEEYEVVEFAPDPPGWTHEIEELEEEYGEVVVRFETNQPSRMGPAIDGFEQAIRDGTLTHDGSEVLRRHIGNCVYGTSRGWPTIHKETDDSPEKIDAAVAAVIAYHRALWHYANPPAPKRKPLLVV